MKIIVILILALGAQGENLLRYPRISDQTSKKQVVNQLN